MTKSLKTHDIIIPGEYDGLWSGYNLKIVFDNGNLSGNIELNEGVRGINCECDVKVDDDGWVHVK